MIHRRQVIAALGTTVLVSAIGLPARAGGGTKGLTFGAPRSFSFDQLVKEAQSLASRPYVRDQSLPAQILDRIDYDAHGRIKFDTDYALFRDGPGPYPLTFFHLGYFFRVPVHMYLLSGGGTQSSAREILYDPAYFQIPPDSPARGLPGNAGFAGFRFQESRDGGPQKPDWRKNDWVAFLGASYFRAIGELYQYGLSARGVAIDVAMINRTEEFPDFTRFYFAPPAADGSEVTVYALLEGPSVTGAFQFVMHRKQAVIMEIDARVFLRRDVGRLGLAPMTSMFWYSELSKATATDWRPEIHDSDGLALWTGSGERAWRPLNDPQYVAASAFTDRSPRGFGLLQRDRVFDHYLDGVHYERRPGLWLEPLNDWGEGAVQLLEIPTDDEFHDNIVAMWVPKEPAKAGNQYSLRYRLYWSADEPFPTPLARCVATRLGRGGQPGTPRPRGVRKFMVEFLGGPLEGLPFGVKPEPVLSAPSGAFSDTLTEAVPDGVPGHWRVQFDFTAAGPQPVDIRLFLRRGDQPLSETWLYQYNPGDFPAS